jgi:hypothetical protein
MQTEKAIERRFHMKTKTGVALIWLGVSGWLIPAGAFAAPASTPTAQDHRVKAAVYQNHAIEYRAVAAEHRKMLADYQKEVPASPKATSENPWLAQMRKHCEALIQNAEQAAVDADKLAEYHELRAKEAEGK